MALNHDKSKDLWQKASEVIPLGVSSSFPISMARRIPITWQEPRGRTTGMSMEIDISIIACMGACHSGSRL